MRISGLPPATPPLPPNRPAATAPLDSVILGGADAPQGVSLEEAARLLAGAKPSPEVAWTATPPKGRFSSAPALGPAGLAMGASHSIQGGRISVLDPATGFERWGADVEHDVEWVAQAPDGTVVHGERFGGIEARDGATGEVRWRVPVGQHYPDPPAVPGDGRMYGLKGSGVSVRDMGTGDEVGTMGTNMLGLRAKGPVATGDGGVLVHADNGLFCFETSTGRTRWHRDDVKTLGTPSPDGILAAGDHSLLTLDPRDGTTRASVDLPGAAFAAPAVGPNGRAYVPLRGSTLAAVQNGHVIWNERVYTDFATFVAPVGERLVLSGTAHIKALFALDAGGTRLWLDDGESLITGPAAVEGNSAFVATAGAVRRLEARTRLQAPGAPVERGEIVVRERTVDVGGIELPIRD